jgi:hypothetical protein
MNKTRLYRRKMRPTRTYSLISHQCPQLFKAIVLDLMDAMGDSETSVAFASKLSIKSVRDIVFSQRYQVKHADCLALFDIFAAVFYRGR